MRRLCLALTLIAACTLPPGADALSQAGARSARPTARQPRSDTGTASGAPTPQGPTPARREWEAKQDWAAFTGDTVGDPAVKDSLKQLLDSGVDVNATDKTGHTALHVAAALGQTEPARYLLSRGAAVDARDRLGRTPLMLSAGLGGFAPPPDISEPWAKLWIAPLCPEREPSRRAAEGLMNWYAIAPAYPPLVRLLIDAKADVNAADGDGRTVMDYAAAGGVTEIERLIRASGRVRGGQKCGLKLAQAPALRGLRLGMTLAEVSSMFPRLEMPGADSCGRLSFSLDSTFGRLRAHARRPEEFDGVSRLDAAFFEGRLAYARVTYDRAAVWRSRDEYLTTLSTSLGLPDSWYRAGNGTATDNARVIGCDGFKVVAGYDGVPYAEMHDTEAMQAVLRRKAEVEAGQGREAEAERERRRRAFKP